MLYLVPTPIGNLKDITLRSLEVLKEVECIYAENPRHSLKLLQAYQIQKSVYQLNQHSREHDYLRVIEKLKQGSSIAYISDAGTPGISDPGSELVTYAIQHQQPFTVLPGANAILPAVVASGMLTKEFYFAGFLPQKKGRKKEIDRLLALGVPVVFYESPYRIAKLLDQLLAAGAGERALCITRELSKLHEEYIRGSVAELASKYKDHQWKGEFVVTLQ